MKKKQYDVFIAYHGTYEQGSSFLDACDLTKFLENKGLEVFFYPFSNKDAYKTNVFEVINSTTFLLVVSSEIHREANGKIDFRNHYELCVEIDSFYSSTFLDGNDYKSPLDSKIVFCGEYTNDFKQGDESRLHELFKDRKHFYLNTDDKESTYNDIYDWIISRVESKKLKVGSYLATRLSYEVQNVYSKRAAMITGEKLNDKILAARKIVCIGISNSELTSRIDQEVLFECLNRGGVVEIFFLKPDGKYTALREIEEGYTDNRIRQITENNLRTAIAFKDTLPIELKDNFKLYLYDVSPRLNLIFVDDNLYLQFYGFISRGMDTPSFSIKQQKNSSPIFDYCQKSYSFIKEKSEEI